MRYLIALLALASCLILVPPKADAFHRNHVSVSVNALAGVPVAGAYPVQQSFVPVQSFAPVQSSYYRQQILQQQILQQQALQSGYAPGMGLAPVGGGCSSYPVGTGASAGVFIGRQRFLR